MPNLSIQESVLTKCLSKPAKDGRQQMSKDGLARYIAKSREMSPAMANMCCDVVLDAIQEVVMAGVRLRIKGFGRFSLEWRKGSSVQYKEEGARLPDYLCFRFLTSKSLNSRVRTDVDSDRVPRADCEPVSNV